MGPPPPPPPPPPAPPPAAPTAAAAAPETMPPPLGAGAASASVAAAAPTPTATPTPTPTPTPARRLPRIASLLPSATEVVAILLTRAGDPHLSHLCARSHECDWPPAAADQSLRAQRGLATCEVLTGSRIVFESSAQVNDAVDAQLAGGDSLYTLDEALLASLAPDVIVSQSLCHVCSVSLTLVETVVGRIADKQRKDAEEAAAKTASAPLALPPPPTIVSLNPQCLEDVLQDLVVVGKACGLEKEGLEAAAELRARAARAEALAADEAERRRASGGGGGARPTVGFCEWIDPIFVGGHWTPQLIAMAGGHHPLNPPKMAGGRGGGGGTGADTACGRSGVVEPGGGGVVLCGGGGAKADEDDDDAAAPLTCGGGAGAGSVAQIAAEAEIARQAAAGGPEACHGGRRPLGASPSFAVPNDKMAELDPDFLVIAPCGLDIPTTLTELSNSGVGRSAWFRGLKAVRGGRCAVVDGNQMFNRPGPRLVDALEFLTGLLNGRPEAIPSDFPWVAFSEEVLPPPKEGTAGAKALAAATAEQEGGDKGVVVAGVAEP